MTSEEAITSTLEQRGWHRQFVASEPRLSEAVEMYRELGFQVHLEPLPAQKKTSNGQPQGTEEKCHTCFDGLEGQHKIIFTKPAKDSGKPCSD